MSFERAPTFHTRPKSCSKAICCGWREPYYIILKINSWSLNSFRFCQEYPEVLYFRKIAHFITLKYFKQVGECIYPRNATIFMRQLCKRENWNRSLTHVAFKISKSDSATLVSKGRRRFDKLFSLLFLTIYNGKLYRLTNYSFFET